MNEEKQKKVVALFSGGLDSTALLYHLRDMNLLVFPLSVNYNQRHIKELEAARKIILRDAFIWETVDLSSVGKILTGSSQTDVTIQVPEGHYAADNMKVTVVPNRNMMLLSVATAYAISIGADLIAYAAHMGDHDQYPDCRREFIDAIAKAIVLCDYNPPQLIAPFSMLSKAQIVQEGVVHEAPMELTWSCYKGGEIHCGRCGTCVERAEAFHIAGVKDPTQYEDNEYWKEVCGLKKS